MLLSAAVSALSALLRRASSWITKAETAPPEAPDSAICCLGEVSFGRIFNLVTLVTGIEREERDRLKKRRRDSTAAGASDYLKRRR